MTEDVRLSVTQVARRCACRGWIVATERPTMLTAERVSEHQLSEPHKAWDRAAWVKANTVKATVRRVG